MAYRVVQIPEVDQRRSVALGVSIPFSEANVFSSVYSTQEQTKYNIINFLLTDRGERPMNPRFGSGIRRLLFDQIYADSLDAIKANITNSITSYFPNVTIAKLDIVANTDYNAISILIDYRIENLGVEDFINLQIQNA